MDLISTAVTNAEPHLLIMLPFAVLLLAIAVAPLILRHHWERHYHELCATFAAITCGYYVFALGRGLRVLHAGADYLSFMVVVGAFYIVAAGLHIRTRGGGQPAFNTAFLFAGALLANLIGTIGASMLLIRPWIVMNRRRFGPMHTAFFIFVVSNVGGALLPVGPPLFLGYLQGVPFWWGVQRCWPQWVVTLAAILLVFYVLDSLSFRRSARTASAPPAPSPERWHCDGARNFLFLVVLLVALVALPAGWREAVMILTSFASFFLTPKRVHAANAFAFTPIREVAWLFLGIFGTMIPVLDYMKLHAADLGLHSDLQFYWASGILSGVLDNAPTYLTFFAGALGLYHLDLNETRDVLEFIHAHDGHLVAISLGATCFGALTYIGNGPNLLVKAIAEQAKLPTPSFFGYVFKWALPVLLPIFVLVSLLFFWK